MRDALDGFDDVAAHSVLDRLLGSYPLESVLRDGVLPYLHELGERWARAEVSVAQEHFASALLRGRLLALARGWGQGRGPQALLACVPGDQHDLGLICFGLALRAHGWRITYLGADTPLATLLETADLLQPALVVVSAAIPELAHDALGGLRQLACVAPLGLAGGGTDANIAETVGARWLNQDPVAAAASAAAPRS
jgi:methanogenic corrinoid protein MtbC1